MDGKWRNDGTTTYLGIRVYVYKTVTDEPFLHAVSKSQAESRSILLLLA